MLIPKRKAINLLIENPKNKKQTHSPATKRIATIETLWMHRPVKLKNSSK